AAAAAAFVALAVLAASGAATGLDQWAIEHAMPLAGAPSAAPTTLEGIVPLLDAPFHPLGVGVSQIVMLPGQVVLSLLLVLAAAVVLLELAGFHTPTDLAGGLLLATAAVTGALALERSGLLRRRARFRRVRAG